MNAPNPATQKSGWATLDRLFADAAMLIMSIMSSTDTDSPAAIIARAQKKFNSLLRGEIEPSRPRGEPLTEAKAFRGAV